MLLSYAESSMLTVSDTIELTVIIPDKISPIRKVTARLSLTDAPDVTLRVEIPHTDDGSWVDVSHQIDERVTRVLLDKALDAYYTTLALQKP